MSIQDASKKHQVNKWTTSLISIKKLLDINRKTDEFRTEKEKLALGKQIMKIKEVEEHLESTPNLEEFLIGLTEIIEYKTYARGEALCHRGNFIGYHITF